ncbi:MAG: sulfotransferase [Desulfobacteraceae bacterium]|nr:sulfotransferase [Desulfobacteraceae bacterium]
MDLTFVGGFLRSGTSMLQTILCSSPDCNPMIGEAIFLKGIIETYGSCLSMFDIHAKYYFSNKEELRQLCEKHVRDFVDKTSNCYGNPNHIVLKHPQLTPHFPKLHELVKEAKFIIIVRDPRDIMASAITAKKRGATEFGGLNIQQISHILLSYYAACITNQTKSFQEMSIYIKYEDLVQSPHALVKRMQHFTGIDLSNFDPSMQNIRTAIKFGEISNQKGPLYTKYSGKSITPARIGRFTSMLEQKDILDIELICKPLFKTFNYKPIYANY